MKVSRYHLLWFLGIIKGCIGIDFVDDRVDERITVISEISVLEIGESYQLMATYWNNIGQQEEVQFQWDSSNPEVLQVDGSGLIAAVAPGSSIITASANGITGQVEIMTGENTVTKSNLERKGTLKTTSSYPLEGDVTLAVFDNTSLRLTLGENFKTTSALPGLYVYLANNPNTIKEAFEIGAVEQFSGEQSYIINGVSLDSFNYVLFFCKPFLVDVGNAELE